MANKITPQVIERVLDEARLNGFDEGEIEALRESLLMRAVDLTGEQRLNLAIAQMADDTQADLDSFVSFYTGLSDGIIKKGKQGLDAMSDSEWAKLVNLQDNGE